MGGVGRRSLAGAALAACILVTGASAQALGATWGTPVRLNPGDLGAPSRVVRLGSQTAIAASSDIEPGAIGVRRTVDGGATWTPRLVLTASSFSGPEIAGRGSFVDVVWTKGGRLRYARSTDGGVSFAAAVALSPADGFALNVDVARGPNGRVAVIWEDENDGRMRVRVSADGGATFGAPKVLSSSYARADSALAIGTGVIYAAYRFNAEVRLRRSLDGGSTWKPAIVIDTNTTSDDLSITAVGARAFIGYSDHHAATNYQRVRYRGTTDKGASWSAARSIPSDAWLTGNVQLSLQGGTLRAVFSRCFIDSELCVQPQVYYRESTNATDWSPAQQVSPAGTYDATPSGVAYAGAILVTYTSDSPDGAFVRRGS